MEQKIQDNTIIFYTTHCPKCKVLEMKLKQKKIYYEERDNVDEMLSLGIRQAPTLKIGDTIYDFKQAVDYINGVR